MNNFFVLSGLYNSGEHILATILLQNKNLKVNYGLPIDLDRINCTNKTLDVNFEWTDEKYQEQLKNTKFIITVREPVEIAAELVDTHNPKNLKLFLKSDEDIIKLKNSYAILKDFFENNKNDILLINYEEIIFDIKNVIEKIDKFLGLESFDYDFDIIDYCKPVDTRKILGEFYDEMDPISFWDKSIVKPKKDLEIQLNLCLQGKIDEAKYYVEKLEREQPSNDRAAFNRGWFRLSEGKLLEGHQLMDRGRPEKVFGNSFEMLPIHKPIWKGEPNDTVLYIMEGGLGDQIHSIKYINKINEKCSQLMIACSDSLVDLLGENGYKNIISQSDLDTLLNVEFDSWVPAMSVICSLKYEYKDLDSKPFLKNKRNTENKKFTIGLRWSGNPKFEHQQHRRFPLDIFFNSVYNDKFDYVCLQRDDESELCPDWVKKVNLDTWLDTQVAVSNCDLVISSCTSVVHLSAGMGVPTWILVPVLPYYLWALPGDKTPHYDSVTLFRQLKYGDWKHPMMQIKNKLNVL